MKIKFLGTGTSHGVPVVDCMMSGYELCPRGVCEASITDSKHRRGRASIFIEINNKNILIDVSADFREQVLREKIDKIDAVLLTHQHADHIMGMPDIRSYSRILENGLPLYASEETIKSITKTFSYIFDPNTFIGGGIPSIERHIIGEEPVVVEGVTFTPIPVIHGSCKGCYGYRFENVAYIPDVKEIPESSYELLKDLDLLIIDCLRLDNPHVTHMILPESLEVIKRVKPKKALFTHMCHGIDYIEDKKLLNDNIDFAYDGLFLEV